MIKVLFINPIAFFGKKHAHYLRDWCGGEMPLSMILPPLDIAYAAAYLRKNGYSVNIIDASVMHLSYQKLFSKVQSENPEFICMPSSWGSIHQDLYLAQKIKELIRDVKIIFSGPNVTVDPAFVLKSGFVDYVICGELEQPMLEIVQNKISSNVVYLDRGNMVVTPRSLFQNLDELPFPARDLLQNNRYFAPFTRANPFTTFLTSRGCPYRCSFCQSSIWYSNKLRVRSVDNVIEEMDLIVNKFKIKEIIFRDLTLTFNKARLMEICEKLIQNNYKIFWRCFSCVDTVDRELLNLMKEAGCHQVAYGFESGSQKILDLSQKGITLEQSRNAAKWTREAGMEVSGSFMFGMYQDTEETVKETLNLALELDPDYTQFQISTPVISTDFYKKMGLNTTSDQYADNRWMNLKFDGNHALSMEFLHNTLKEAYKKFYFRKSFIWKQLKKINNPRNFIVKSGYAIQLLKNIF